MANEDDIRLYFSVAEKRAFLERHGYVVKRTHVEKELFGHGSSSIPFLTAETVAELNGVSMDLHMAFAKVLRAEILKL